MLKLSDPFEMNDLFVGIFYNAETEALANDGEGSQKSNQRLKQLYRRASAMWRKLRRAFEGNARSSGANPATRNIDGQSLVNESAGSEFRPLTEEEKRQFLNSLNEEGRRILAELAGKNEERRSHRSVARVVKPNPVGIAPDIETSDKRMVHISFSDDLSWKIYRVRWRH